MFDLCLAYIKLQTSKMTIYGNRAEHWLITGIVTTSDLDHCLWRTLSVLYAGKKGDTMIDLKKDRSYKAVLQPEVINVPSRLYIMVDGAGVPCPHGRHSDFQDAMEALYGITYAVKFWDKHNQAPKDYDMFTMAPVETLWWMKGGGDFDTTKPEEWLWTVMLRVPAFVTQDYFDEVQRYCLRTKKTDKYQKVRLERMHEGKCVQALHMGPYRNESETIDKLRERAKNEGYDLAGKHHKIYFNDPRRTEPSKLRTIIRCPIKLATSEEI